MCVLVWDASLLYFVLDKVEQYHMSGDWRGHALIINNHDFSRCPRLKNRDGTDLDERKYKITLITLRFYAYLIICKL